MALRPRLDHQIAAPSVDVDLGAGGAAAVAYDLLSTLNAGGNLWILEFLIRVIRDSIFTAKPTIRKWRGSDT